MEYLIVCFVELRIIIYMDVTILVQIQLEREMAKSETEMTKMTSETQLEEKSNVIAKLSRAGELFSTLYLKRRFFLFGSCLSARPY